MESFTCRAPSFFVIIDDSSCLQFDYLNAAISFDPFLIALHTVTCQLIIDLGLTI